VGSEADGKIRRRGLTDGGAQRTARPTMPGSEQVFGGSRHHCIELWAHAGGMAVGAGDGFDPAPAKAAEGRRSPRR